MRIKTNLLLGLGRGHISHLGSKLKKTTTIKHKLEIYDATSLPKAKDMHCTVPLSKASQTEIQIPVPR